MNKEELTTKLIEFANNFSFIFSPNEIELLIEKITSKYQEDVSSSDKTKAFAVLKKYIKKQMILEYQESRDNLFKKLEDFLSSNTLDDVKKLKILSAVISILGEQLESEYIKEILRRHKTICSEVSSFLKKNKGKIKTWDIDEDLLSMYPSISTFLNAYIDMNDIPIVKSEERKGLLTFEEVKNLYKRFRSGDKSAKEELMLKNMGLARQIAYKYTHSGIDYDDLFQEGMLGLETAINKYKPELGYAFSTYATWHVRQRIQRYVENNQSAIRLPVHKRQELTTIKKKMEKVEKLLGKTPTPEEYIKFGNLTMGELQEYMILSRQCVSIEQKVKNEKDDADTELGAFIPDPNNSYEELLNEMSADGLLAEMKKILKEREFIIVCLRNGVADGNEYTLEEIGAKFNVTRERIRQIEAKAYKKLRCSRKIKQLSGILAEIINLKTICNYDEEALEYIRLKVGLLGRKKLDDIAIMNKMVITMSQLEKIKERAIEYLQISDDENIKMILEAIENPDINIDCSTSEENLEISYSLRKKPKSNTKSFKEIFEKKYTEEERQLIMENMPLGDLNTLKRRYGQNLDEVLATDSKTVAKVGKILSYKLDSILRKAKNKINNQYKEQLMQKLSEYYPEVDLTKVVNLLTEEEQKQILEEDDEIITKATENILKKINYMLEKLTMQRKNNNENIERKEVNEMIQARTFKQILEDSYNEEQIKYIMEQLTEEDKEFLKKRYGENLDEVIKIDDKKLLARVNYIIYQKVPNKVRVNREALGTTAIGIKPPKKQERKQGSLRDYLKEKYSEEEADLIISDLTEEELILLKRKYGEQLDGNSAIKLDPRERNKINNVIYSRIPKRITEIRNGTFIPKEQQKEKMEFEEIILSDEELKKDETVLQEENSKEEIIPVQEISTPSEEEKDIEEHLPKEPSLLTRMKPSLIEIRDALNSILSLIIIEEEKETQKTKKK